MKFKQYQDHHYLGSDMLAVYIVSSCTRYVRQLETLLYPVPSLSVSLMTDQTSISRELCPPVMEFGASLTVRLATNLPHQPL